MTDTARPYMSAKEAKQFTRDFSQLNARLIGKLTLAKTMEEAKEALSMLENLANFDLPQAKTLYGMMFLMNGKPWYDITKALYWLKKGANEGQLARCVFIYPDENGQPSLPEDIYEEAKPVENHEGLRSLGVKLPLFTD